MSTPTLKFTRKHPKGVEPGTRYNRLTVLAYLGKNHKSHPYVRVRCECGVEQAADVYLLINGKKKSCGCYSLELITQAMLKARPSKMLKNVWKKMKARCYHPSTRCFHNYGGRGIKVCDRWVKGENGKPGLYCFHEDMGDRAEGMTIERKNVNGHYTPENCVWLPRPLQDRNRRTNTWLEVDGVKMVQVVAEELMGMPKKSLSRIVRKRVLKGITEFVFRGRLIRSCVNPHAAGIIVD